MAFYSKRESGSDQGFVRSVEATPNTLQCCYRDANGRQCRFPGSCSTNTLGGGPWYCHDHFREQHNAFADEVVAISRGQVEHDYSTADVRKLALDNMAARYPRQPGEDGPTTREEVLAELRRYRERMTGLRA